MEKNNINYMDTQEGPPYLPSLHDFDDIVKDADIPQFLSAHKATMRFPETLLFLMVQAEREAFKTGRPTSKSCIGWTTDGRAFVIRNKEELTNKLLPVAFSTTAKFSSFTRKLYRWGFRQVKDKKRCQNGELTFWHPYFQRDNKSLIVKMKSTTAEGTRRALENKILMKQHPEEMVSGQHLCIKSRDSAYLTPTSGVVLAPVPDNESPYLDQRTMMGSSTLNHSCLEQNHQFLSMGPWTPTLSYLQQGSNGLSSELVNRFPTTKEQVSVPCEGGQSRYTMNNSFQTNNLTTGNDLQQFSGAQQGETPNPQATVGALERFMTESALLKNLNQPYRSW